MDVFRFSRLVLLSLFIAAGCTSARSSRSADPLLTQPKPTVTGDFDHAELAHLLDALSAIPELAPGALPDGTTASLESALTALDTAASVIANNLANAETTAFKRCRVNLTDMPYQTAKRPDTGGEIPAAGKIIGTGVRVSGIQLDLEQGSLESTNRPLDVAIQGEGFFKVKIKDTIGNGIGYTRNGNFFIDKNGQLVLGMGDGYKVVPPISVPSGVTEITIDTEGQVSVLQPGTAIKMRIGRLQLSQFVNAAGLQLLGGSLFVETAESGEEVSQMPGEHGAGTIMQGFLEASNVDATRELLRLHKLVRWRNALLQAIKARG